MLLVSDMFGVKCWMYKEPSSGRFMIDVEDYQSGKSAKIVLETGAVIESNLPSSTQTQVLADLRKFKQDYVSYWQENSV